MNPRSAAVLALALLSLALGVLSPPVASANHPPASVWEQRPDCAGPFNCDIPNPSCNPQVVAGCEDTKRHGPRINRASQRYDIPGTKDDRWPIATGTHLRDGFGNPREEVRGGSVHINYGQRRDIAGTVYVWAHAAQISSQPGRDNASGWVPQSSITDERIAQMETVSTQDPGHGHTATDYRVDFHNTGKFGGLKIAPNSKAVRMRAADYLEREGVIYLQYSLPGNGGYAIEALPENAQFKRAKQVKAVTIDLYRPRSREQHPRLKTMKFVYGQAAGHYGWIATDAIRRAKRSDGAPESGPPSRRGDLGPPPQGPPPQTSGIVGARQVAVGGATGG